MAVRSLPLVVFLFGCAGPPPVALTDAQAAEAFVALHEPIYRIYGLGVDRDGLHAALSASFVGEALTREYVEHFGTVVAMQKEDTAIQVLKVDYEHVAVLDRTDAGVRVDADWSVGGIVTHQAHKHPRVNRYRAVYTLAATPQGPRIVDTKLRNLARVQSLLGSGDDWLLDGLPQSGGGLLDPLDYLEAGLGSPTEEAPTAEGSPTEDLAAPAEPPAPTPSPSPVDPLDELL